MSFVLFLVYTVVMFFFFFFQAEDGIRDGTVTGVQTCALPIWSNRSGRSLAATNQRWPRPRRLFEQHRARDLSGRRFQSRSTDSRSARLLRRINSLSAATLRQSGRSLSDRETASGSESATMGD